MKNLFFVIVMTALSAVGHTQGNPTLTAIFEKEKQAIKLRWQHQDPAITSYVIQRSSDNVFFSDVYTKHMTGIETGELLKFSDRKTQKEKNYYRLKIFRGSRLYETTLSVMVISGNTENGWVIYPVPVGPVLNLQYTGSGAIEGVISVTIESVASGKVFTKLRLASTSRNIQIPVSNIGNGLYDIRVYVGNEIKWNQRFVK
ncbi:MAG: hypothetical protein WKF88_11020 [Ferruginibacter sp.]